MRQLTVDAGDIADVEAAAAARSQPTEKDKNQHVTKLDSVGGMAVPCY